MEKFKKGDIALSTFNFLFSELISFLWKKDEKNVQDNLKKIGCDMGFRLYHIISIWENSAERQNRILPMVKFVQTTVFKYLFGKEADKLSVFSHPDIPNKNLYVIRDNLPIVLKYVPENEDLVCSVFVAGIIEAVLNSAGFDCEVTAQTVTDRDTSGNDVNRYPQTQYLIVFKDETEKKFRLE